MGARGVRGSWAGVAAIAALTAAAPAVSAPLAAGPVLPVPAVGTQVAGVADVSVTHAGDALVVLARAADPIAQTAVLQMRPRRGARGRLSGAVTVTPASPPAGVESALGADRDACVAYPGASGLVVKARRG